MDKIKEIVERVEIRKDRVMAEMMLPWNHA